jgi:hypothetical protein
MQLSNLAGGNHLAELDACRQRVKTQLLGERLRPLLDAYDAVRARLPTYTIESVKQAQALWALLDDLFRACDQIGDVAEEEFGETDPSGAATLGSYVIDLSLAAVDAGRQEGLFVEGQIEVVHLLETFKEASRLGLINPNINLQPE